MSMLCVFVVVVALSFAGRSAAQTITSNAIVQTDCLLPLPRFAFFAPLVFGQDGVLLDTELDSQSGEHAIRLASGDSVHLSCSPNNFKFHPTQTVRATCKSAQTMLVNDHELDFRKGLGCEMRPIEEIKRPAVNGCDPSLTGTEFGFHNPVTNRTYVLGEACYHEQLGRTKFVHTVYRHGFRPADIDAVALRIVDDSAHFGRANEHPESRYKVDFLVAAGHANDRLQETFGVRNVPHLQPARFVDTDLLLSQQFASMLKLGGNYLMFGGERAVDLMARSVMDLKAKVTAADGTVEIYAGTHGVLRATDRTGANAEVYLDEARFPVAKFIWLVAVSPQTSRAIAYVVPNGIGQSADELCPNQCADGEETSTQAASTNGTRISQLLGLMVRHFAVHCCKIRDIMEQVYEMPLIERQFAMFGK